MGIEEYDLGMQQQRSPHFVFVVQSLSHIQLFVTPWTAEHQAPLSSNSISQSLLKFMSIELVCY